MRKLFILGMVCGLTMLSVPAVHAEESYFDKDEVTYSGSAYPDVNKNGSIEPEEEYLVPGHDALDGFLMDYFYTRVPAEESITGSDVCIYLEGSSLGYLGVINNERVSRGLNPMVYSEDLNEGAMLRAGEILELYFSGTTDDSMFYTTKYSTKAVETQYFKFMSGMVLPQSAAIEYLAEGKNVPADYTYKKYGYMPYYNNKVTAEYTALMNPALKYGAQGMALSDNKCDGTLERAAYVEEHSPSNKDLYPDFQKELDKKDGKPGRYFKEIQALNEKENQQN